MFTRSIGRAAVVGLLLLAGCGKKGGTEPPGAGEPEPAPAPGASTERPSLTAAECEAKQGQIVGDIGDGAIHRPDYTCAGGLAPLGSIRPAEGEPVPIEGAVCCPPAG